MAVKVFDVIGEEALYELYNLIESVDGATIAGREMQKITSATSEYYSQWWYFNLKYDYEYKAAQFATKKDILGANIMRMASNSSSAAGSGLSTVSGSAEVATAVDVGTYTAEGAEYSALKGVGKVATGTATESTSTLGSFVFGEVLPFVGAVATGVQVGLAIDDLIYSIRPDWWQYNVENWDDVLLGHDTMLPVLHNTRNSATYMTEDAFLKFMQVFNNLGAFNTGEPITYTEITGDLNGETINLPSPFYMGANTIRVRGRYDGHNYTGYFTCPDASYSFSTGVSNIAFVGRDAITMHQYIVDSDTGEVLANHTFNSTPSSRVINGKTYTMSAIYSGGYYLRYATETNRPDVSSDPSILAMYYYLYGEGITYPEVMDIPGMTQVGTLPSDVNSIQNSYPDLWNNRVTTNGVGSDGRNKTINWIPVPMPSAVGNQDELESIIDKVKNGELESTDETAIVPVGTGTLTQTDDGSYEDPDAENKAKAVIIPEALIDLINAVKEQTSGKIKIPTGIGVDVPLPPGTDNSGDGDTDPPVVPAGSISNGLAMVYNPVRSELVAFSRYLWSTNFIDLIPKLFQNPMDAIIGLHEIYVTPSVGGRANIVCGYLDSGVESNYVDERYVEIDCGSVDISENFGTVFDYMYTDLEIFLPFIGYVKLDIAQVMRSKLSVKYTVDVLTGACNARIYVKRDSYEVHAYSFDGCCAASLPYSAGTNAVVFQVVANAGLGLITGGIAGAAVGAAKGLINGNVDVRKSGSFNPNAASMDDKVPFIIMQRNIDDTPNQFNEWQGYPLHQTAYLGGCKGYTIATNIHYSGPATSEEIAEIEDVLSKGAIL